MNNATPISQGLRLAGQAPERSPPLPDGRPTIRRASPLAGARVLVVEDEFIVAAVLEDTLEAFGCRVVGPASRVGEALDLIELEPIDAAVLDVNIAGEVVMPVADALASRGIPFVFATAYGRAGVEARHLDRAVLQKPYDVRSLQRALEASLQGRS